MQHILRPAVSAAGDNSKHVFHAERDAGPVMRFHFRHGHDEIGRQNGSWKPQVAEAGIVRLKLRFDQLVAIEIHEGHLAGGQLIGEASFI